MSSLASILSRLWHALFDVTRKEPQEETAKEAPGENKADDLTIIRGIGNPTQDQLYKAGIKTYAALAGARPEELREVLGDVARSAKIERWIAQARELGRKGTT
jgi:predicted flap endonuclease-1-like 5' DNA nuclease